MKRTFAEAGQDLRDNGIKLYSLLFAPFIVLAYWCLDRVRDKPVIFLLVVTAFMALMMTLWIASLSLR